MFIWVIPLGVTSIIMFIDVSNLTQHRARDIIVWKLVSTLNLGHQANYSNYIKFYKLYIYKLSILNNINKTKHLLYCTKYFIFSYTVHL
jgi:hypothetical protein